MSDDLPRAEWVQLPPRRTRPVWQIVALLLAGASLLLEGIGFGILIPLDALLGGGVFLSVGGVEMEGVSAGLVASGVTIPWAVPLVTLVPLGLVTLIAIRSLYRGSGLPLLVVAALWVLVAVVITVVGSPVGFLANQVWLLVLAVAATWPDARDVAHRLRESGPRAR